MKELSPLKVIAMQKDELMRFDGGSIDPQTIHDYAEDRYGTCTGTEFHFSK